MQMTTSMTTQMQAVRERIQAKWDVKVLATAVLLFLVFITGFAIVQYATPALVGNDGYYHMKMGYLIRTEGIKPDFPYLPYTILNETAYYDHHLLYHVFLGLFATTDPALDGGLALTQGVSWPASLCLRWRFWRFGGCCAGKRCRMRPFGLCPSLLSRKHFCTG